MHGQQNIKKKKSNYVIFRRVLKYEAYKYVIPKACAMRECLVQLTFLKT